MIEGKEYFFDWHRIFVGDFNWLIYVEIIIRVLLIMSYTMLMLKWIGKRAIGELGSADMLLIVALGSAVGDAMLYPTIPLTVAVVVITAIAALQKFYVYLNIKFESFRKFRHSQVVKIIENGILIEGNLTKDYIDKHEVFMLLRNSGIKYLSEVEHAYYEQSGHLSIYKFDNPKYENSILPEDLENFDIST